MLVVPPAVGGYWLFQSDSARFEGSDEYLAWSVWAGVAMAIWLAIGVRLSGTVRQLRTSFEPHTPAAPMWVLCVVYALFATLIAIPFHQAKLPAAVAFDSFQARVWVVVVIGLMSAAPAVFAIWLVAERLRQLRQLLQTANGLGSPGHRIDELRRLWQHSLTALAALSVALSVGVFTIEGLRALASTEAFPPWKMLLLGLFLTIAFASVYVPMLLSWRGCSRQLVNAVYMTPATGKPGESWTQGRARLMRLLGLEVGLVKRLSDALIVLAPLAASLLPLLPGSS
ncbi:hypothetical protein [Streptomyces sp. NPDC002054]|uniref:hypothetical protein n=1 Tax=Streptomyces sp. NPDC002054 TaxID=3154663 RepID=UPI00332E028E